MSARHGAIRLDASIIRPSPRYRFAPCGAGSPGTKKSSRTAWLLIASAPRRTDAAGRAPPALRLRWWRSPRPDAAVASMPFDVPWRAVGYGPCSSRNRSSSWRNERRGSPSPGRTTPAPWLRRHGRTVQASFVLLRFDRFHSDRSPPRRSVVETEHPQAAIGIPVAEPFSGLLVGVGLHLLGGPDHSAAVLEDDHVVRHQSSFGSIGTPLLRLISTL